MTDPAHQYNKIDRVFLPTFFSTLFVLHCVWASMIVRMAVRLIKGDKDCKSDIREKKESKE